MIAPVKIEGEVVGGKDRSLASVGGELEMLESEMIPPELGGGEVGELGDAVNGGGVEQLVALGLAQVSLEDRESVVVLLLRCIAFTKISLEEREVMIGVEEIILAVRYDLADQGIGLIGGYGGGYRRR